MEKTRSAGRYISCIHRNFHIYLHHHLQHYQLGGGQIHFLMMLYHQDGVNQEFLADRIHMDKATCARALKKLEQEGYVIRKTDQKDRRNYTIFLTEKAKQLRPKIKKILKTWTQHLLTDLSEDEQESLYILLEKITTNAIKTNQQD